MTNSNYSKPFLTLNVNSNKNTPKICPNLILPNFARTKELTLPCAPKTPLITPRIGMSQTNKQDNHQNEENPWLPCRNEGSLNVKIAAITPIGTIAMVPTSDRRPVPTPRNISTPRYQNSLKSPGKFLTLKVINEDGKIQKDPILDATIYLDCNKTKDYKYVANKMKTLSENTLSLHRQYKNILKPLINISGKVSSKEFETALQIYENNQVYYQDRIDNKDMDLSVIKYSLTQLEYWFLLIIEPMSNTIDDVREREHFKLRKGISSYCDPELYNYITPATPQILNQIINNI